MTQINQPTPGPYPNPAKDYQLTWLNPSLGAGLQLKQEMAKIGMTAYAQQYMGAKGTFYVFRAQNIKNPAANILKQEFLAKGAEATVHPMVVVGKAAYSSVLLFGTQRQYEQICQKFSKQQFGLPALGLALEEAMANSTIGQWCLEWGQHRLKLGTAPKIMGILNLTPDSFSDGGSYQTTQAAVAKALDMVAKGADIIDIGGESTRPGYLPVSATEELARVVPVIQQLKQQTKALISVDTYKPQVAAGAILAGADLVNDIWGLQCPHQPEGQMAAVIAQYGVPVIAMHNQQDTAYGNKNPNYQQNPQLGIAGDLLGDMGDFFRKTLALATQAGIPSNLVILDIGFGFGKTQAQNLAALAGMGSLKILGRPLLVGTSRKSTLGNLVQRPVQDRAFATAATVAQGIDRGAAIVRVHDVAEMKDVALVAKATATALAAFPL